MFAPGVIMPGPPGTLHRGLDAATASLRANPDNVEGRVEWTPIRVGLSADGQHGFTFGFMTLQRKDGTRLPLKYMSYWVKGSDGWRVAGYKRARRPEGEVSLTPMAPLLPAALVARRRVRRSRGDPPVKSLADAERAFSDEAQTDRARRRLHQVGQRDRGEHGRPEQRRLCRGPGGHRQVGGRRRAGTDEPGRLVHRGRAHGVERRSRHLVRLHPPQRQARRRHDAAGHAVLHHLASRPAPTSPWRYIAE